MGIYQSHVFKASGVMKKTLVVWFFVVENFREGKVDGALLLKIDQSFLKDVLFISHALLERKLLRAIRDLNEKQAECQKVVGCVVLVSC